MLVRNPKGHYHFLKGSDPYSCGVIADPRYEIVHVTLREPLQWRRGFDSIDAHLKSIGEDRHSLCGMELRSPAPFTIEGFVDFNRTYCEVLQEWDLYVDGENPVARTNVVPLFSPPSIPTLHAFSYTIPAEDRQIVATLVISGAGELREGVLEEQSIIRLGETNPEAMREKASYVMRVMEERLQGLGARWDLLNAVDVYTVHPLDGLAEDVILSRLGPARRHGLNWHHARPPIQNIEFEMDMRGVRQELNR
jgi:hypothetical protein